MSQTQGSPRVVVRGLTVSTVGSGAAVVDDVSLEVASGEVLGVVGESGSGKTTLGLAMIGHVRRGLKIASGSVIVDGSDLTMLSVKAMRSLRGSTMAYVPQDPATALNPALRIGSQLKELLTTHHIEDPDGTIDRVLTEVGLVDRSHVMRAYPHQLSGGQQQRVAIAMAFATRPGLIVLDEPTTGLDVTTQRTVLQTVAQLCASYGVAAVYVSHDVAVVAGLADRVVVLYSGRVVETGFTPKVFDSPAHPYTKGLLRAVPSPDRFEHLVGIAGVPPRPTARPSGCCFAPRCPDVVPECSISMPVLVPVDEASHLARCIFPQMAGPIAARPLVHVTAEPEPPAQSSGELLPKQGHVTPALLLRVRGLDAYYGAHQVLHDIALDVPADQCVAIVGESGSGKTTLSHCLAGLHTAWTGEVNFDGTPLPPGVRDRSAQSLRDIQYVFQNPYASLNPRRTIGGLIRQPINQFHKYSRKEQDSRILEALRSAALPAGLVNNYPDQLSGGERQRVAIARALSVSPRLLICDEVTSALDVSVQANVVELLRELQAERGLAMVFVTHNIALARSLAQHVVVMHAGRVVESGSVKQVMDEPAADYTQRLMRDVPKFSRHAAVPAGSKARGC